ncbi:MAG: S8 family serine peptidase [Proteobacteria bacterium]|nr:S8 family serine peptidase [Pseudomonadota bacterium]
MQFHRVLNGHGTSCAAIISGDGYLNGQLQGLAPNSKLLSYTLDTTGQDVYTIDEFMNMFSHAKSQNVDVISISWGFTSADLESQLFFSRWLDREITSAGIVIATAAGNEGPAITSGYSTAYMPQNGFSVGAMISSLQALNVYGWNGPVEDTVVWYSSVGPSADNRQSPDIISPIISLVRGERNANGGNFYGFSGTSSATPALAGSLASLISVIRNTAGLKVDTHLLKVAIQSTSRRLASVENIRQGAGLVNVDQAYDAYLKLYREKHQTEATQKFAYKLDVKTPLTDRPGFGEGIHLSKLDRNGMTIEVSLNEESLNRVDRFAFADAISIHHSEQFISIPDAAVIQASPTKISVRFNEAALAAPGIYTDIIELRSSGGEVLLKQIPVVIEIPSQLSPAKLVQHINIPSFSAFSIKRSVIDLDQKGMIKFNGIIQKEFPSTGDSFGVFVTSKTGERVFDSVAPMSVNGPTVVDLKTEVLLPGRYEVVFFRNISRNSSFGGPVGVFLSISTEDKAISAIKDFRISDGSASLLLDIAKTPKVESVVVEAKKRRVLSTLVKTADTEKKFAFVGVIQGEFAEGELQIELNHLEIDQSFAKFSQMSLALIDSDSKDVLYRGWVETRTIGRPSLTVELAKASKELQIFAYPNIVDWDRNPITEFNFSATIPLNVPTTFKSNSIVKLSNMAKLSFQSADITDELRDLTFILLDKDNIEIGRY